MVTSSTNWKQLKEQMESAEALQVGKTFDSKKASVPKRKRSAKLIRMKAKRRKLEGFAARLYSVQLHSDATQELTSDRSRDKDDSELKKAELTKVVGLDCEYVGVGRGGSDNMLARVSIVNMQGHCIYDKYVKPSEKVTDYRTAVSGIRPADLLNGLPFQRIQYEVHKLLNDRVVVGHALENDFKVLHLSHTRKMTRDTATFWLLRKLANISRTPSLKLLAKKVLGIDIQHGEHDSIADARAAMQLYVLHQKQWENHVRRMKSR